MKISSYKVIISLLLCFLFTLFLSAAILILCIIQSSAAKIIGVVLLVLAPLCFVLALVYADQSAKLRKQCTIVDWGPPCGVQHIGKVYGYEFDGKYKKLGKPMVVMDVLYFDYSGKLRMVKIPTDRTKAPYSQNSNLAFKLFRGVAVIEGGEIAPRSERELEEMLKGVDIYKTHPQTGYHCPACGAIVNMPSNMTARCPYCDNLLRVKKVRVK